MNQPYVPMPYGPNTASVRRFLVGLAGLGAAARAEVVAAHEPRVRLASRHAAENTLGATIERSGRDAAKDALGGPLFQLVSTERDTPVLDGEDGDGTLEVHAIAEPALAAILAVLVADLLAPEVLAELYGPFESVLPLADVLRAGSS